MKTLFIIMIASMALTACGERNNSEANRDDTDNYENNSPAVTPQDNARDGMDTTGTDMRTDTTTTGGTTGTSGTGTSGSGYSGGSTTADQDANDDTAGNP